LKVNCIGAYARFMILACTVLTQYSSVTDRRTDRQTDTQAMAKTREAFCYRA